MQSAWSMRIWFLIPVLFVLLSVAEASAGENAGAADKRSVLIELDGTDSADPDGDPLKYIWRQVGGPTVTLSSRHSSKPYFRATEPGTYSFELRVSDGRNWSKPALVEVVVEKENLRPEARIPAEINATSGDTVVIDGSSSRDADGDPLAYEWAQLAGPPLYLDPIAVMREKLSIEVAQPGVYELQLIVSDGKESSAPAKCRLVVTPPNNLPVAKAKPVGKRIIERSIEERRPDLPKDAPTAYIEKLSYVKIGHEVVLDGRKSFSPKGTHLRYYWKQRSGPFIRTFDRKEDALLRFTPEKPGDYTFELVVSDGASDSLPAIRTLKVRKGNEPPIAVGKAPQTAKVGERVRLDGSESFDKEGALLTYEWEQAAGPRVTNYALEDGYGQSSPSFIPAQPGEYVFRLTVSDGEDRSTPAIVKVLVEKANNRPQARVGGNLEVNVGQTALLQGAGFDPDGDELEYVWAQVSGPLLLKDVARQKSLSVKPVQEGKYVFSLTVSDGELKSRPAALELTVVPGYPAVPAPQALVPIGEPDASGSAAGVQPVEKDEGKASGWKSRFLNPFGNTSQKQ